MAKEIVTPVGRVGFRCVCGGVGKEGEFVPVTYSI